MTTTIPPAKQPETRYPLDPLIRDRWSPRAFADRPVDRETIGSLLEAARWAASCSNEQPWMYIVAPREDAAAFQRALSCLVPFNQGWAKDAPLLMISLARTAFAGNGQPNRHAFHDVGAASAQLTAQATSLGLVVHQMGGIDVDRIRTEYALPAGVDPVAGIAIGWPGDPETLSDTLKEREKAPRERKSFDEMVLVGWAD